MREIEYVILKSFNEVVEFFDINYYLVMIIWHMFGQKLSYLVDLARRDK